MRLPKKVAVMLSPEMVQRLTRDMRQDLITSWAEACFGEEEARSVEQRGLRFLEEAIELFQASEGDRESAHKLVDYIFDRPVGVPHQELGGVSVTLLCLAESLGHRIDHAEAAEIARVLRKPPEEMGQRNQVKKDAGFVAKDLAS